MGQVRGGESLGNQLIGKCYVEGRFLWSVFFYLLLLLFVVVSELSVVVYKGDFYGLSFLFFSFFICFVVVV